MADSNRNTFNRPDTFFGICESLGQDFGFNPLWLRLAFVPALFFFPFQAPLAYLGLGLIVLASRKLFPAQGPADAGEAAPVAAPAPAAIEPVRDERVEPVLLAA
jgi:phage shock protein PspC (stress-responsive transcriptional regulator)